MCNLRVHLDVEALNLDDPLVALLDLGLHPLREDLLKDGRTYIGDVLLQDFPDLLPIWQIGTDLAILVHEFGNVVER